MAFDISCHAYIRVNAASDDAVMNKIKDLLLRSIYYNIIEQMEGKNIWRQTRNHHERY